MSRGRRYGAGFVVIAGVGLAAVWLLSHLDIDAGDALLIPCGAFLGGGLFLLAKPGADGTPGYDFTDWFDELPKRHRVGVYLASGCGAALGGLVSLYLLAEWLTSLWP